MRGLQWPPGLPVRFAVTVGLISFIAALIVSIPTFLFSRSYLLEQRETSALSRALVDASAVQVALSEGDPPNEALAAVPTVGDSQAMLQVDGDWFTQGVTVSPDDLPPDLLSAAPTTTAPCSASPWRTASRTWRSRSRCPPACMWRSSRWSSSTRRSPC